MVCFSLLLCGCAVSPAGVGNAQYHYQNGECEVTVNSARELAQANVQITPDCQVTVTSAKVSNDTAYLGVIQSLAGALR